MSAAILPDDPQLRERFSELKPLLAIRPDAHGRLLLDTVQVQQMDHKLLPIPDSEFTIDCDVVGAEAGGELSVLAILKTAEVAHACHSRAGICRQYQLAQPLLASLGTAHQHIHLDRVSGPVDGHVELHPTPAAKGAQSHASIAETPVTRTEREAAGQGPSPTPLARILRVDETECVDCNLCPLVCPVNQCITMVRVDTGLPLETWDQRARGASCAAQPHS